MVKNAGVRGDVTSVKMSQICRRGLQRLALLCTVLALGGCPTYEDGHSGRYLEQDIDELQDEAVAIDFFRFGSEVRAVLRRYDIASVTARQTPFAPANEVSCRWTRVDRFDEASGRFSLTIDATERAPRVDLSGTVGEEGQMDVTIVEADGEPAREVLLAPSGDEPDARCTTIDDFLLRAIFDDSEDNSIDDEIYGLRNPVFALLWATVEPVRRDGFTEWVALNRVEPAVRLSAGRQYSPQENGFLGSLSLNVPPPAEQILVDSGQTRYGLAHFVIIDDGDGEERFNWTVGDEPVVATALEAGAPEDIPDGVGEINGWGKALLFVEGRLDALHPDLRLRLEGLEAAEQGRHFYIVDVFFYNDEVVSLRLPAQPEPGRPVQRRVSVHATTQYLEAEEVLVPRLFPY